MQYLQPPVQGFRTKGCLMIMVENNELFDKFTGLTKEESKILLSITLKYFRLSAGMGQNELAKKLGTSFQQIQKYENGKNKIPTDRLVKICNILNITLEEFLEVAFNKEIDINR